MVLKNLIKFITNYNILCVENWLGVATKQQLLEAFNLTKKLWPIYGALAYYRLMSSVDLQALKSYYANRPSALVTGFKEYIIGLT